ncbi:MULTISPECIES: hypothetical protein [unclassified Streptomyces]|uniref:hypothetical protein n=1 Tax=unclassified Streptomyces TaxID=2593676 RepID=UPI003D907F29
MTLKPQLTTGDGIVGTHRLEATEVAFRQFRGAASPGDGRSPRNDHCIHQHEYFTHRPHQL